ICIDGSSLCYYDLRDWRLFIDTSKASLKAVLFIIGNVLHSISMSHTAHIKYGIT
ncbi:Uncharacterized protein FKW44_004918, partial [Caligus rogercresseyi]